MAREHLGLFDTPPSRRENGFALAVVGVVFTVALVVVPLRAVRVDGVYAFIPTISAAIFVGELIVAALLYAQAAVFRSTALTVLASGYVLTALLLVPYALTFPGVFAPGGLLDPGLSTTAWLMIFRRWAGPITVILYAALKPADMAAEPETTRSPFGVLTAASAAAALAASLTMLATVGHDLLPPMFSTHSDSIYRNVTLFNLSNVVLLSVAISLLLWRRSSVLDTWIAVSLATALIESLLNLLVQGRFTLGWYCLFMLMLASHLIVLLVLIAEANRLYVRQALAAAARGREREARLMSMDSVAAAISHEIGQPLAGISLSASAALTSLTRPEPNTDKAVRALHDTIDAAQRAFAVVKSIRNTFGKRTNVLSEFNLNDLVRETALVLDTEMAAQKVWLRLELDDALPPIVANRVQLQRVLVNLLMNAIEALGAVQRRPRHITIRSAAPDAETLRLEVSDNGEGVAPEAMGQIFDPFFTTKAAGTGLGLSLSRSIVEDHGGRLWACATEGGGATFHLELHRAPGA